MKHRTLAGLLIAVIALLVLSQSILVVPQGDVGVVLRFQRLVRSNLAPGLHFKWPFLDHPVLLSSGWIVLDGKSQNGGLEKITASDGRPLQLGYMLLWRITDVDAFCGKSQGCDESQGAYLVNQAALPLLKAAFSSHSFDDALIASQDKVLNDFVPALNRQLDGAGMTVRSVRVTELNLTDTSEDIVYTRMRSAQSAEAAKLRAEGKAAADRIKAEADQQRAQIMAQGRIQAQKIRGDADAEAAKIYAQAARADRAFFHFYLGLQAYRRLMQKGNNVVVLGPDSLLSKYLTGTGGR